MVAQADPRKYVWDALQAAERASRFTKGRSFDDYLADDMLRAAVERQFEIIGEALGHLRRVAPELVAKIPDLTQIITFRNILIHGYANIDDHLVWGVIERDLPLLITQLGSLDA